MDEDGRFIGSEGAAFYQINVHWVHNPSRTQIFPEKGVRVVLMLCHEDELGNVDFDKGFHLTHSNPSTMAKMIDRLFRVYPGLREKVQALDRKLHIVPGSVANN